MDAPVELDVRALTKPCDAAPRGTEVARAQSPPPKASSVQTYQGPERCSYELES
jgi:hypothetical protein